MNPLFPALFMLVLIPAYAFMGAVFIACRRQGQAFIASVNKAFEWESCFLVIGCCLNTAVYMA
jgi:hypothetical protein